MLIQTANSFGTYPPVLIFPLFQNETLTNALSKIAALCGIDATLLTTGFKAELKEMHQIYVVNRRKPELKKVYLLGLGANPSSAEILDVFRSFAHRNKTTLPSSIGLDLLTTNATQRKETIKTVAEAAANGILLGHYNIGQYKTNAKTPYALLSEEASLTIITGKQFTETANNAARKGLDIAQTQMYIFHLVNGSSNHVTPTHIGECAIESGARHGFQVTVYDKIQIQTLGLHALLAVNRGSETPPTFIVMEYQPKQHSNKTLPKIGLVGKGITFDTGGLSIKTANMQYMKSDMGGAAAVLGAMEVAAKLQLPLHLIGIIPSTENSVDATAIKPSDVINSYSGKTIEVDNTDAEGRLILADGLAYLKRNFNPDVMIDLATLTGNCVMALGYKAAGLFCNSQALADKLLQSAGATGERLWQLPLWDAYKKETQSDVADIKNHSGSPLAGAIVAAKFLEAFIENHTAWAHLDIAGTAFSDSEYSSSKSATGYGIRLLTHYLEQVAAG